MDATSPKVPPEFNQMCNMVFGIEQSSFSAKLGQKNTVIKYTKLPDYDFDSRVSWPRPDTYVLRPGLRDIVLEEEHDLSYMSPSRSFHSEVGPSMKIMTSSYSKRKIVTISEDEEPRPSPLSRDRSVRKIKSASAKPLTNRSTGSESLEKLSQKTARSETPKYHQKEAVKTNYRSTICCNRDTTTKPNVKNTNRTIGHHQSSVEIKNRTLVKDKQNIRNIKSPVKGNVTSSLVKDISDQEFFSNLKNKLVNSVVRSDPGTRKRELHTEKRMPPTKTNIAHKKPVPLIRVPVPVGNGNKKNPNKQLTYHTTEKKEPGVETVDSSTETDIKLGDVDTGTDPAPLNTNQYTEAQAEVKVTHDDLEKLNHEISNMKEIFYDCLNIPKISLTKDRSSSQLVTAVSEVSEQTQLPEKLSLPITPVTSTKDAETYTDDVKLSPSYVISRKRDETSPSYVISRKPDPTSNPLTSLVDYPLNVVTVYKATAEQSTSVPSIENKSQKKGETSGSRSNRENYKKSCSDLFLEDLKFTKPSELISSLKENDPLLEHDCFSEQFQREINFIDSFFESLQYLENCSLSDKSFAPNKVEKCIRNSGFDMNNPEYGSVFSRLENGLKNDDSETMASKSLCLLNLLIRDEQRRAKNLLFVLKMREDALKDFTKSQILWLENKKKLENTDISTLKKKQRGALLKLQHECGEMQQMRKALLALSEKRKVALMKTKKNIELKLKNNVVADQILLGKKKIKRVSTGTERPVAPLKCFDLSSSGCDDTSPPRVKSDSVIVTHGGFYKAKNTKCVEKCIQTGNSLLEPNFADQTTDTESDNFVTVDGTYLNILFNNLSFPEIFSSGKQYEVNGEALKNIVNNAKLHTTNLSEGDHPPKPTAGQRLADETQQREIDASSTPSTARSLVDELDQYYKGLADEDKVSYSAPNRSPTSGFGRMETPVEKRSMNAPLRPITSASSLEAAEQMLDNVGESQVGNVIDYTQSEEEQASDLERSSTIFPVEQPLAAFCPVSVIVPVTSTLPEPVGEAAEGNINVPTGPQPDLKSEPQCSEDQGLKNSGPLPVPAGAADTADVADADNTDADSLYSSATGDSSLHEGNKTIAACPSLASLTPLVPDEAEELRRQQLAIEREIKALEQQQSQLLAVREIPDKPPPPYTPPADARPHASPRTFLPDHAIADKVHRYLCEPHLTNEPVDICDVFLQDFCREAQDKRNHEQSDKPWDACNLLPQKAPTDKEALADKTVAELKDVLSGITAPAVMGVGARRLDHIDDILFTEWRRCEPDWTSLYNEEASVKNQLFEGIFQKVLTETIDEFKKTVHSSTCLPIQSTDA